MQIKLQNDELILQKLFKLKCSKGCQNSANYIVYQLGLFCTTCLSKLQDVPQDQLATLEDLSKVISQMTQTYKKSTKTGSNLLVLKAQAETQNKVIKNLRDGLTIEIKSIYSKTNHIIANAESTCLTQYSNESLESFFEPSLTTSVLLNETQLFIRNINNLKVICNGNQVSYQFQESDKNPQLSKNKALKQFHSIGAAIDKSHNKVRNIMQRFRNETKNI